VSDQVSHPHKTTCVRICSTSEMEFQIVDCNDLSSGIKLR
jgi:hypothetical protein